MADSPYTETRPPVTPEQEAIEHLRRSLMAGRDWPTALLEAIALWTAPEETYRERHYIYFIDGEAFDWLLLAERLLDDADGPSTSPGPGLVPEDEKEALLFNGKLPPGFDESRFKEILGVDKYRGCLNYYYGVTVEEALQLATEQEVQKRYISNGIQYKIDFSEEACEIIYRAPRSVLLRQFRQEKGYPLRRSMTLSESKEFTYWLFKYRLKISDRPKTASDTRKGLEQLQRMIETVRLRADGTGWLPASTVST